MPTPLTDRHAPPTTDSSEKPSLFARRWFWRLIHVGPRLAYAAGLGPVIGRFILLLTTRGRRSGKLRVTPLAYEEQEGAYVVASARGPTSDWLLNLRADPRVRVRVGGLDFAGQAEIITEPGRIADYIEHQLARRPRFFGAILRAEGLPSPPSRQDLEGLGARRPMVILHPLEYRATAEGNP
ncbi:MAG TPA: nitroreductase/quinone reductase family protein [Anaerolineales bacterium]|nr:nitroreductase/quinone reductase family protein [Anaerolineales bacterium]